MSVIATTTIDNDEELYLNPKQWDEMRKKIHKTEGDSEEDEEQEDDADSDSQESESDSDSDEEGDEEVDSDEDSEDENAVRVNQMEDEFEAQIKQ